MIEVTEGSLQEYLVLGRLLVGRELGFRLGEDEQELIAIAGDLGLLSIAELGIECGPSVGFSQDAVNLQCFLDRAACGL